MTSGRRVTVPTYKCDFCHALTVGPEGQHGDLCPRCETGHLCNVAVVTDAMLARAELGASIGRVAS